MRSSSTGKDTKDSPSEVTNNITFGLFFFPPSCRRMHKAHVMQTLLSLLVQSSRSMDAIARHNNIKKTRKKGASLSPLFPSHSPVSHVLSSFSPKFLCDNKLFFLLFFCLLVFQCPPELPSLCGPDAAFSGLLTRTSVPLSTFSSTAHAILTLFKRGAN